MAKAHSPNLKPVGSGLILDDPISALSGGLLERISEIVLLCRDGVVTFANGAAADLLADGHSETLVGQPLCRLLHHDYAPDFETLFVALVEEPSFPIKFLDLNGKALDFTVDVLRGSKGEWVLFGRNITETNRALNAVVASEIRFKSLVQRSLHMVLICESHVISFANPSAVRVLGATNQGELVGRSVFDFIHGDYQDVIRELRQELQDGHEVLPIRAHRKDGVLRDLEISFLPLAPGPDAPYVIEGRDITDQLNAVHALREVNENLERLVEERTKELTSEIAERKKAEAKIRYQATYDQLTGLPNRTLFFDRLRQETSAAKRAECKVTLMFLDLDGFKLVNDTLGHDAGDILLKETAQRLCESVRDTDTVSRLGGDEFTIIMAHQEGAVDAAAAADRIIASIRKPFMLSGQEATVSTSIGISVFPEDAQDAETLVKNADAAMYMAKNAGKSCYSFFTEGLNKQAEDKQTLREALDEAVERDEFSMVYQPKIRLSDGAVCGMEALMRWSSPSLGVVPPGRFIPILEETGLIVRMEQQTIRNILRQMAQWRANGLKPAPVAINLSKRHFRYPKFLETLTEILNEEQAQPGDLELEVTEALILSDGKRSVETLHALRDLGVKVNMDNFGKGVAAISSIKTLPLAEVKIDRSFVSEMLSSEGDRQTVQAIIALAHCFGRQVAAEGVETQEQAEALQDMGCDAGQGFLFSHPIRADDVAEKLDQVS